MHAVIFDIDGTLLHSAEVDDALYRQAVHAVLGDVRLRATINDYQYVTDTGILRQIFKDNNIPWTREQLDEIRSLFVEFLQEHIDVHGPFREIPGARDLLETLIASPIHSVAMATGGWQESAELKLRSAGIHFPDIPLVTSNDHYERTGIMKLAVECIGENFESVSYYGDGPWDRAACVELGWQFVAVGTELEGLESYIGHAPVFRDIRAMRNDDMDAIFRVRTSVVENHMSEEQLREIGITRESIADMLEQGELKGWCALAGDEVVGFSLATASSREVNALFVLPDHSKRGLGQALLDIAVFNLRRIAPGTVRLRTDPAMPAYRFYLKRGWRDTGETHENGDDVFLELE